MEVGGSPLGSFLLPIGRSEVICDSQLHSYVLFFITSRIRVNVFQVVAPDDVTLWKVTLDCVGGYLMACPTDILLEMSS